MADKIQTIVVAGDVTIDWLQWRVEEQDPEDEHGQKRPNWELHTGTAMAPLRGGALLLADLVAAATDLPVLAPEMGELHNIPPREVLHSNVLVAKFPHTLKESQRKEDKAKQVFRVKEYLGYCGPGTDRDRLKVQGDDPDADLVILDDVGNGFRDHEKLWPVAIKTQGKRPLVILKVSRPLMSGELWNRLTRDHADRLIVVISADDLRAHEVNISRSLSWERTATDFFWQMAANRSLNPLNACRYLIVRLGLDGAILYSSWEGQPGATLYYDPTRLEDGFMDEHPGGMTGLGIAFTAALAAQMIAGKLAEVGEGVRQGIMSSRRLVQLGFGTGQKRLDYPGKEVFQPLTPPPHLIADIRVPSPTGLDCSDPDFWEILQNLAEASLEDVAVNTVISGKDARLDMVPVAEFGNLKTLDRREMESLRSIQNLLREYLKPAHQKRPLSLAVFGAPGAGKSFTVTQVAKSLAPGLIERLEFNLSQWTSPEDLIKALHQVRDVVLTGKVPLVFFDEFDAKYQTEELGWLKYFLEPMQDGRFKEGESMHPIGRAIFVFAGGTSTGLKEFTREGRPEEKLKFQKVKGPDFVSRLRGYVDVMGVNLADKDDRLYIIRRAIILRNMLKEKAPHLFDRNGQLQIQWGVLYALLSISRYEHGVRSMEAVLDMSMLAGRPSFEQAALPPREQLGLHVEVEEFCKMVNRDVLLGSRREKLAQAIHERYRKDQEGKKPADHPAMQPWECLAEDYRESNRQQADHMPAKLKLIGYGFRPVIGREPVILAFAPEEVERLAEMEHDRYVDERIKAGWRLGPDNAQEKTNPTLEPWKDLEEKEKDKDRKAGSDIPALMAEAGFEVYRPGR